MVDKADAFQVLPGVHVLVRGHDQFQALFDKGARREPGIVRLQRDQPKLIVVLQHRFHDLMVGREAMAHDHPPIGLLEGQQDRVQVQADAARRDQRDLAVGAVGIGEPGVQPLAGLVHLAAVVKQGAPGGGQFDGARPADQKRAELAFQVAHMLADGSLGQVEAVGGAGKAAQLRQGDEGAKPLRVHHNEYLLIQ
ncbi:hypothetical protein D9M68_653030 [compost metagenome]